jgi:hypothetical protein
MYVRVTLHVQTLRRDWLILVKKGGGPGAGEGVDKNGFNLIGLVLTTDDDGDSMGCSSFALNVSTRTFPEVVVGICNQGKLSGSYPADRTSL